MHRTGARIAAVVGVLLTAAGAVAAPAGAGDAAATPAPGRTAALAALPVRPADSLVDSYGVGVHLGFLDTPYTNVRQVALALEELGVRHVRDDLILSDNTPLECAAIGLVARQAGVGFDLIMGRPDRLGLPADYVRTVATLLPPGVVESLEGVNEWDHFGPQGPTNPWVQQMKDWQGQLYAAAKAEPATADLPILSPALAFRQSYAVAGDLTANADVANAHVYPDGHRPANQLSQVTAALRASIPDEPLVVTETGYHNATSAGTGQKGVPEAVAGVYAPRMLLEHAGRDEQRVYSYELLDERPDPGRTDPEAEFGLLRHDFSPKPAYTAMKNLLALVDDPGPSFTPTPLPVALTGLPSDGRSLLYQKRDGRYVLFVWRDVDIYDPATRQDLAVAPASVTLGLDAPYRLSVHRPSASATAVSSTVSASLSLSVDGAVTAVTIDPAATPGPPVDTFATTARRPDAPSVTLVRTGPGTATVTWRRADGRGAPVTGYRLVVMGRRTVLGKGARRATLHHLPTDRPVRISLQARNAIGWSRRAHVAA